MRRNSITPFLPASTFLELVIIDIPSIKGIVHEDTNFGAFSISTRHILQFPAIESLSW